VATREFPLEMKRALEALVLAPSVCDGFVVDSVLVEATFQGTPR
jgi:hypothetical protein